MKIKSLTIVSAAVAAPWALAADVNAPESIEGASIKFFGMYLRPPELSVVKYRPQGGKAEIILSYFKTLMPRVHTSATLSGASSKDGVDEENTKPAVITFSGKKDNTYYGTVEGSWSKFMTTGGRRRRAPRSSKSSPNKKLRSSFPSVRLSARSRLRRRFKGRSSRFKPTSGF